MITFVRAGYWRKLLIKIGLLQETLQPSDAFHSWQNCLQQLDMTADIVFLGDSITRNSDFRQFFPGYRICNLGCAGDSILNIAERVGAAKAVNPKIIFVMAGINTLASRTLAQATAHYKILLSALAEQLPHSRIVLLSVLPVSSKSTFCSYRKVERFNEVIRQIVLSQGLEYVDLFSLYAENGSLPDTYSPDGLHLNSNSYDIWANAIRPYIEEQAVH